MCRMRRAGGASFTAMLGRISRWPPPFTDRGLAHFSARFGPKNVPVPFGSEGDSPIFAALAAKIGTVPAKGCQHEFD